MSKRWRTQKSASSAAFLVASEKQAQQQLVAAGRGQQKHGVARTASSLSKAASHLSRSLMSVAWITHAHHSPTAQTLVRAEKGRAAYAWHDVVVGRAGAASAKRPEASSSLLTGTGGCTGPRSAGTYAAARTDRVGVNHQHALSTRAEHAHSDGASFPTVLLQLQHLHGVLADGKFQRDLQLNQERPGFSPMVCLLQFLHGNRAGTLMPRCRTLQHGEPLRAEAEAGLTSVVPSQLPSSTTMISYVNDGLAACENPARKPARDVVWVQKVPASQPFCCEVLCRFWCAAGSAQPLWSGHVAPDAACLKRCRSGRRLRIADTPGDKTARQKADLAVPGLVGTLLLRTPHPLCRDLNGAPPCGMEARKQRRGSAGHAPCGP